MTETNNSPDWESIVASKENAALYLDKNAGYFFEYERTELAYWAAFYGKLELLKWLKEEKGVNLLSDMCYSYTQPVPVDGASDGGQIEILEYFIRIGYKVEQNMQLFRRAIKGGHLEFLKHFHFKGYDLTRDAGSSMSNDAARYGHFDIVKFLHEIGGAWGKDTCRYAAGAGRLDILQYAHENGCDWSHKIGQAQNHLCCEAAKSGSLDCLKYVHENSACELIEYAAECAAKGGHLDCLIYLHENGVELSNRTIANAAKQGGNSACIQYVQANNQVKRNLEKELHSAVASGDEESIRRLVREGANINAEENGESLLIRATRNLTSWAVISLLVELGADVNSTNKYVKETVLHKASLHSELDLARLLLDRAADIEAKDDGGQTPLAVSSAWGKLDIMALLLDSGANIEAPDKHGLTPIFHACESGQVEAIRMLLDRGANVRAVTPGGWNTLTWAHSKCRRQHNAVINLLIDRGAPVQSRFLRMVCQEAHTDLLVRLLDEGADIQPRAADGNTVAHGVTDLKVLDILLERDPSLLHSTNNKGQSLLYSAGSLDVLRFLLSHGLDVNARDKAGLSPLHVFVMNRADPDVILELLGNGDIVNASDDVGRAPLHFACSKLNEKMSRMLLDDGADVNQQDNNGDTPLHTTCSCYQFTYHVSLIQLLLDRGADMSIRNAKGQTAVHVGCSGRREDNFVQLMLKRGADVNAQDNNGATPLLLASRTPPVASRHLPVNDTDNVGTLLKYGADATIRDHEGRMPIHIACENNVQNVYEQLLKHREADLMARDANGRTPMHIACEKGYTDLVRFLSFEGAPDEERDNDGNTPLHYACFSGHWDIALFLIRRGGSPSLSVTNNAGKLAGHGIFMHDGAPLDVLYHAVRELGFEHPDGRGANHS